MAKKTKGPSMRQTAKLYKKNTKPSGNIVDTASSKRFTTTGAIPTMPERRTPNPKLKPKSVTLGGTRGGKGATTKKLGRA